MTGSLVISLDFELLWGVRDHADRNSYGANILGARKAIPRILELFAEHDILATWATVGFLFCEGKEELLSILPPPELRPNYKVPALSNYSYITETGRDEASDPYCFAPSLIRQIAATPGQEVGTHTLSHCYCLEDGFTVRAFEADLLSAKSLAERHGIALRSIVFPRNQYASEHLDVCRKLEISVFRGNPSAWAYRLTKGHDQTAARRAVRLLDAHTGVLGSLAANPKTEDGLTNVAASRFLRPNAGRLARVHPLHQRTILKDMSKAARLGKIYHLWWHPHNFGRNLEANIDGLKTILMHFRTLADTYGMRSRNMEEFA